MEQDKSLELEAKSNSLACKKRVKDGRKEGRKEGRKIEILKEEINN